jgi:putative transposase
MILSYRYRVKDATTGKVLDALAWNVNTAWNRLVHEQHEVQRHYCAEMGPNLPWPGLMALRAHFTGHGQDCGLHSDTLAETARVFHASRNTHRKCPRNRGRKSLGWVPFIKRAVQIKGDAVTYMGNTFRLWLSRPLGGPVKTGQFVKDARGRWHVCFQCETQEAVTCGTEEVGIDLGCSILATLSTGEKIENPQWTRKYEDALAVAQRARNKGRVKAVHAKIKNSRRHRLHVESSRLVGQYSRIVVGDVNAAAIAQTRLGKSSLDAAWTTFRDQLRYKCQKAGASFEEASERYSTQACSACGSIGGPRGIADLGIRRWVCCECGVEHCRDTNAALNILVGAERRPLAEEILVL